MIHSEAKTGNGLPVGHRRKPVESSGPQSQTQHATAEVTRTVVGRRRRSEGIEHELNERSFSHSVPGSRRKIAPEDTESLLSAAVSVRLSRPVGSRRKPEPVAATVPQPATTTPPAQKQRSTAPVAQVAAPRPSRVANEYHLRSREPRSFTSPVLRRRLVPVVGFSALALASVAAFVDVSSLPGSAQYKDVITAAAISNPTAINTSRDLERAPVVDSASARAEVEGSRFVTKKTDIRADASKGAAVLATLTKGQTVRITGVTEGSWSQVIHKDLPRWVKSDALSTKKPPLLAHEGQISAATCARGSSIEARLQPDTIRVYRAVCERFPEIRQYWGQANRGTHSTGHSLDIMVSGERGKEVAAFLQARQAELGVEYLIYQQKIWNIRQAGAGWRGMADRGGTTANHYDHVHVTTFGSSAK